MKPKHIVRILNNHEKKDIYLKRLNKEELNKVLNIFNISKHKVKFFIGNKSVRFCNFCNEFTVFSYNKFYLHSKCCKCGYRYIPSIHEGN